MTDEKTKRAAVEAVFRHPLVWLTCRRDTERCGRIADSVWGCCAEVLDEDVMMAGDTEMLTGICHQRVRLRDDYADAVSFIPVWLIAIVLKLIIGLLIDFWLKKGLEHDRR